MHTSEAMVRLVLKSIDLKIQNKYKIKTNRRTNCKTVSKKFPLTCDINLGSIILNICSRTWVPDDSIACAGIARNAKGISMLTLISQNNPS